jgi:hypothetical protein
MALSAEREAPRGLQNLPVESEAEAHRNDRQEQVAGK